MARELPQKPTHLGWIDSVRGIACLIVAHFHALGLLWVGWDVVRHNPHAFSGIDRLVATLSLPAHYGYVTLMLFFVISGFCIHWPYARSGGGSFDVAPYALRRFLRIYPPYLAAVILTVMVGIFLHNAGFQPVADSATLGWQTAAMIQNYAIHAAAYPNYWDMQLKPNACLWSLPVEAEFYIIYPFIWFAFRRARSLEVMFAIAATVSIAAAAVTIAEPRLGIMTDFLSYWSIWLLGAVVAQRLADGELPEWTWRHTVATVALIAVGLIARRPLHIPNVAESFIWGSVSTLMMVRFLTVREQLLRALSEARPLAWLGKISYSLYLVHFPVYCLVAAAWTTLFHRPQGNYLICVVLTATALPVAWLFWRFVELPSLSAARVLASRIKARPAPKLAIGEERA